MEDTVTGPTDDSNHLVDVVDSTTSTESSTMIRALERAWSAIRARHPEVPAAVIVVGAGSGSGPGLKLGHFAAMRWGAEPMGTTSDGAKADRLPEVFVGGEGLARGPADVLATLLHEAAHALAHVRGIKDTSRQGRWHNARFKALADELGIVATKDSKIGWSPTALHDVTRHAYTATIDELGQALTLIRTAELQGRGTKAKASPPALCGCGRKIRVSKSMLAAGPIVCGVCGDPFDFGAHARDSEVESVG
ncbi:SprT-like domain-containing protein [Pseudonocardia pini]|uniref:SprT-like domain-containing protein n=1 Tax=Pseudonocardia pini TaxID=2758030 RepID=UPI001C6887BF|nr:SprT-like domain-containing protein [Pseudonocardia pini]